MAHKGIFIFVLALLGVLAGCAPPSLIRLGNQNYPPKPADYDMKVFVGEQTVPRTYMEVCLFSFNGTTHLPGRSAVISADSCKAEARKAGCDAIVVEDADTEGVDLNPAGRHQEREAVVKGIKFVDPSDQSQTNNTDEFLYLHVK